MLEFMRSKKTRVYIEIRTRSNHRLIKRVYDTDYGPFIYGFSKIVHVYLRKNGTFKNPQDTHSEEAVSWKDHAGPINELNWNE